tara:strand:+ start:32 stop:742 length:711 start_codon:yes stop_codon:yes gene_type:complete
MALPKLNSSPKYQMTIPSSNARVNFRPFLMKEEKTLMIAMESQDPKTIMNSLLDTINACVVDKVNENKLTSFDVEYMFLQIRSKSVGETAKVGATCVHCEHVNEVEVNLDEIKVDVPEVEKILTLDENIKLEVDWPAFKDIVHSGVESEEVTTEQVFKIMKYCFKAILTENERVNIKEVSAQELDEFIDSMTSTQFNKVRDFIESMPRLEHKIKFKCVSCNHDNETNVEGMTSFLS